MSSDENIKYRLDAHGREIARFRNRLDAAEQQIAELKGNAPPAADRLTEEERDFIIAIGAYPEHYAINCLLEIINRHFPAPSAQPTAPQEDGSDHNRCCFCGKKIMSGSWTIRDNVDGRRIYHGECDPKRNPAPQEDDGIEARALKWFGNTTSWPDNGPEIAAALAGFARSELARREAAQNQENKT